MPLPQYTATRYVTPLREGGSLPAVVEVDEAALFAVKFRGAGQGAKALVAEIVAGELARRAGMPVPEIALVDLDASFGRTERDPEIQDLLKASEGLNVGLEFLDGAFGFDPVAFADLVPPPLAADLVWLDAFLFNLDRTPRNPNLLIVAKRLWLIDHGAALYFHHDWAAVDAAERARAPFPQVKDHVLLPLADGLDAADVRMREKLTLRDLREVLALVPDALLLSVPPGHTPFFSTADAFREAYLAVLAPRLEDTHPFVAEAVRAQAVLQETPASRLPYRR